jgi:subtilase family serine protease
MPRNLPKALLVASILTGVLCAQPRLVKTQIRDTQRIRMNGHIHPMAKAENDLGSLDAAVTLPAITLVLGQTPEQQTALAEFLAAQQNPSSPDYHRWLTPEQYADRFGASPDDIAKISAWLEQHNLHVTAVGRARTSIVCTGAAGDVEQAFQISFHRYSAADGNHFANTAEPSLPVALQIAIRSIHGLNDFRMQPKAVQHATLKPGYTSTTSGNHYLSPDDLGTIYNIKALWNSGYDGSGQKIAIAGQTRVDLTDIQAFRAKFQLPAADPQMTLVPNTRDPGTVKGDLGEADLDLEWAGAAAPQAAILYVYSADVMDAVQYIIDQNLAPVLSVSYGLCEPLTLRSDILTMQSWARQANAQGMTWVNASGDSGGADCVSGKSTSGAGLAVDSPADIPEVTGVGGTTFQEGSAQYWNPTNNANGGSATSYIPETVWNDSTPGDPGAGGGGASTIFAQPAWQTGLGVPNNSARNVPDIALAASPGHDGYLVYNAGQLAAFGGTSAGTPAFAGIVALLNQYLVATGAQAAAGSGNINPRLYALAQSGRGAFHDVTSGDNIVNVTCGARTRNCIAGSYGYSAGQGYDQASGLGSIDAYNLVTAWSPTGATARAAASVALQSTGTSVASTGSLTITATVTGASGSTPTGSVTFTSGDKQIGVAPLSGSGSSASASIATPGRRQ